MVVPGVIVISTLKVIVVDGCLVGVAVGVAFGVWLTTTTTTSVVGTVVGTAVVTMVVGTGVATVVVVTGVAGCDVHPASRIPINRIARTTKSFFMHLFLLFRYISIFNYFMNGEPEKRYGARCFRVGPHGKKA